MMSFPEPALQACHLARQASPEKMPSTRVILSPVSRKCFKVAMTGSPAPTVACRALVSQDMSTCGGWMMQTLAYRCSQPRPCCTQWMGLWTEEPGFLHAQPQWVEDVSSKLVL